MSLLKLIKDPKSNQWAQQKAIEIINAIPSQNLISEAYLFGSAVEGTFTPDSDLDFLIVAKDESAIKQLQHEVYRPHFTNIATDWIFKTESSFHERKRFGGVCFVAFYNGMKLR